MKILNAFSLSMVSAPCTVRVVPVENPRAIVNGAEVESFVGHADTARLFSNVLGIPVECRRESIHLAIGEVALVGQYVGPRLPEGTTELPEGAKIVWLLVYILE